MNFAKFFAAMVVVSAGIAAHAGSASYDFRFDMHSKDFDKDTNTAGTNDWSKMYLNRARLDFKGAAEEGLDFRLRFRFDRNNAAPTIRDGLSSFVDFAYLTHKLGENMALTLGKFGSDIGGFEAASTADRYELSGAYGATTTPRLSAATYLYYTGLKFEYMMGDHNFAVHLANQEPNDVGSTNPATTTSFSQNSNMTGLVWKGTIAEMWKTIWAYHTVGTNSFGGAANTDKGSMTFISLGNRFNVDAFMIDFDYLMNSYKDSSSDAVAFPGKGATGNMTGMILALAYKMDSLTPKLEYSTSNYKNKASDTAAESDTKYGTTTLALEYAPGPKGFRYHAAYGMRDTSVAGVANATKETDIILGARLTGDFLKN